MKKKVLASLLCVAMAATMAVGCGSKADAPADAPAADDAAADDAATDDAAAGGDYHFEIIVKSYQSSYWQAAVKGVEQEVQDRMLSQISLIRLTC